MNSWAAGETVCRADSEAILETASGCQDEHGQQQTGAEADQEYDQFSFRHRSHLAFAAAAEIAKSAPDCLYDRMEDRDRCVLQVKPVFIISACLSRMLQHRTLITPVKTVKVTKGHRYLL